MLFLTHFDNFTYNENKRWRENNGVITIYNSPIELSKCVKNDDYIYVIEMNNSTNKIEGIGKIKGQIRKDLKYKIYSEQNYNRYTYRGNKRIERDCIDEDTLKRLEFRLFVGIESLKPKLRRGTHLKRGQGILKVPEDINNDYLYYIKTIFNLQE